MVESVAKVNIMYRGFVIDLHISRKSNGRKGVYTSIRYHVPDLKPKYAERIEDRKTVETQNGEIECMKVSDTIGYHKTERLKRDWYYNPKFDEEDKTLLSKLPFIGSDNIPPNLSKMIPEVVESVQDKIDEYI